MKSQYTHSRVYAHTVGEFTERERETKERESYRDGEKHINRHKDTKKFLATDRNIDT